MLFGFPTPDTPEFDWYNRGLEQGASLGYTITDMVVSGVVFTFAGLLIATIFYAWLCNRSE